MLVLHGALVDDAFHLWGEASPRERQHAPTCPDLPPRLPFDPGRERLARSVRTAGARCFGARKGWAGPWILWAPTSPEGGPVPSSPLVDGSSPPGATELVPWSVTTLPLSPDEVVELLAAVAGREVLAPGVVAGTALRYWLAALRLAAAVVVRQRVLPTLRGRDGSWEARWEPVLDAEETERAARLADAMPAACRALSPPHDPPPARSARAVLEAFLHLATDALVRSASAPPGPAAGGDLPSFHHRWLRALRAPDPTLDGDPGELERLSAQSRSWRRPLELSMAAPYRLGFRLEEPETPRGEWLVRLMVRSAADPQLQVDAADAWDEEEAVRRIFRTRSSPREVLLAALGQASLVWPRMEESLLGGTPVGVHLDTRGARRFLIDDARKLEQAGFDVELPGWWSGRGERQRLCARAEVVDPGPSPDAGRLDSEVGVRWRLYLGGEAVTREELERLAVLKSSLTQVRGRWVEVGHREIKAALALLDRGTEKTTLRQLVHLALGAGSPGPVVFDGVEAEGWVGEVLERLRHGEGLEPVPQPEGFRGQLRPYQERGFSWLTFLRRWGLGACLADDMGLGKTIQALALLQRDWEGGVRGPTLLVCPTSLLGNWQREAERFTPQLPLLVHHGPSRHRGSEVRRAAGDHALVLTSYALLARDLPALSEVSWAGVILDEAQNIKNPETRQARAARDLEAAYRVALTGTPLENHVGDLWSLMEFLNPGLLGPRASFKRRFLIPIQVEGDPAAAETLKQLTGPFVLRRLKTDREVAADLPEKQEMKVYCNLTREQAELYEAIAEETTRALNSAEGARRRGLVLAALTRLKQVCNHPAQLLKDGSELGERSGKLARLTEMLEEVLEGRERALVFTQFTEMGTLLRRHLRDTFGREVLFLHGGVERRERDRMVERFQQRDGNPPLFVLSLRAGGTGLNLTAATHVFHFDRWWNPAVEEQATDRAYRIGQDRTVQVHKLICLGTVEERIDQLIESKKELADEVVGSGEAWLTELSTDELRELFALRDAAIGD